MDWSKDGIREVAAKVCGHLKSRGIQATLVGGACVAIYSKNKYVSQNIDFVTFEALPAVAKALGEIGFTAQSKRHFARPDCRFYLEFLNPPVAIGGQGVAEYKILNSRHGKIRLLTPTDCVKDRLASFYYWDDPQAFQQALWVAKSNAIDLPAVEKWSKEERQLVKYKKFRHALQTNADV
ncbi:hypothetical protein JW933_00110 [candidate division FCPU426 bacterium]|nr:hypothetical protein [candidate division FCPU426 bacterium]